MKHFKQFILFIEENWQLLLGAICGAAGFFAIIAVVVLCLVYA